MFREVQRVRRFGLSAVIIIILGAATAIVAWGFYEQIVRGHPWGSKPGPDWAVVAALAFMLLMLGSFCWSKMTTEVRDRELYLRFDMFLPWRKRIPYERIRSVEARDYEPLDDYLGWGIRSGADGACWTVRGKQGVFLRLADGEGLLVGSQHAGELAGAIREQMAVQGPTGA